MLVVVVVLPYVAGFDGCEYADDDDDDDAGAAPVGGGEFRACEKGDNAVFDCS